MNKPEAQLTMEKETYWTRFADDFEERNNYVAGTENISEICDTLRTCAVQGHVLELGCGNGTYSKILAETATLLRATDFSEEMISASRERLKSFGNIRVEQENCLDLSYEADRFDAIVMVNLLHVIPNPEQALRESRRVLKPGSTLTVVSFTTEGLSSDQLQNLISRYLETYGPPPETARTLTVEATRDMLEAAGFRSRDARLLGTSCTAVFVHAANDVSPGNR